MAARRGHDSVIRNVGGALPKRIDGVMLSSKAGFELMSDDSPRPRPAMGLAKIITRLECWGDVGLDCIARRSRGWLTWFGFVAYQ